MVPGELSDLVAKVEAGRRLSREEGYRLQHSTDLLAIGYMADLVRRRIAGNAAYFINNYHINHTNICYASCKFCAFAKHKTEESAYTLDMAGIEAEAVKARAAGATEVHVTGGLNSFLPYEYYLDLVRTIRRVMPAGTHVQAFDAVEVEYIARRAGRSVAACLADLREAGVTALPGGGGEICSDQLHQELYPWKINQEEYIEVHRIAHGMGIKSNCSMMYGLLETPEERIDHLVQLREVQDETGGFLAFISFPFHPANTPLAAEYARAGRKLRASTTGMEDLRHHAVARIMLDNIPHIRAFWMSVGMKMAQSSLAFGVDDLDGTVRVERIVHDAGATTPQAAAVAEMVHLIRQAGRTPVERDTLYNPIKVWA